jgi:putative transcriptional regulator
MSDNEIFDGIMEGLEDAVAYAKGDKSRGRVAQVPDEVDVRAIRRQTGLTQQQFARVFGITVDTLRQWEQGRRKPRGPSRVLLTVIHRAPRAVLEALDVQPGPEAVQPRRRAAR